MLLPHPQHREVLGHLEDPGGRVVLVYRGVLLGCQGNLSIHTLRCFLVVQEVLVVLLVLVGRVTLVVRLAPVVLLVVLGRMVDWLNNLGKELARPLERIAYFSCDLKYYSIKRLRNHYDYIILVDITRSLIGSYLV